MQDNSSQLEPQLQPQQQSEPQYQRQLQVKPAGLVPHQRHYLAVFFLSLFWGTFGVDRMYLGKWWSGLLKLVTAGGFGVWTIIDIVSITLGKVRDGWGRPLTGTEYRSFIRHLINITAVVGVVVLIIVGALLVYVVASFFSDMGGTSGESLTFGPILQDLQNMFFPSLDGIE